MAAPMPWVPPVTRARLPANSVRSNETGRATVRVENNGAVTLTNVRITNGQLRGGGTGIRLERTSAGSIPFLAVGIAVGGVLAAFVFAISVVSIPAMVDRDINVVSAIGLSLQVVRSNFWTLALWAWLIALLAGAGLAFGFVGLAVTLPILGHATWHAYRDLVEWET